MKTKCPRCGSALREVDLIKFVLSSTPLIRDKKVTTKGYMCPKCLWTDKDNL